MTIKNLLLVAIVLLVAFVVWVNWPEKKVINSAWQMDYDAAINAGYTAAQATEMANKAYSKYVYA